MYVGMFTFDSEIFENGWIFENGRCFRCVSWVSGVSNIKRLYQRYVFASTVFFLCNVLIHHLKWGVLS